jgi:hypothetical protein
LWQAEHLVARIDLPRSASPENPMPELPELEDDEDDEDELLLVVELLLDELLDELLDDDDELLLDELLEDSSSPPPQAASRALNIPINIILRIIVMAPHMSPASEDINAAGAAVGKFHHGF